MKDLNNITAQEVMTRNLITVDVNQNITEIDSIFQENNIHHIPVVKNGNEIIGIISKYDVELLKDWGTKYDNNASNIRNEILFNSRLASDIMIEKISTVQPDTLLSVCSSIFQENKFHSLPVVDQDKLVGIVTTLDLIKLAYPSKQLEQETV